MKKVRTIITIVLIIGVISGMFVYKYLEGRTILNTMPVAGNDAGNLYAEGLFCEVNGKVYFTNILDGDSLYCMNPDETGMEKISSDTVHYINADEHYVYYTRNNNAEESSMSFLPVNRYSLCRIDSDGKHLKILDDSICEKASLINNSIFYTRYNQGHTSKELVTIGIDGKNEKTLNGADINPSGISGESIYYTGVVSDHNVHRLSMTGQDTVVVMDSINQPIVIGDICYGIDLNDKNRVVAITMSDGSERVLSSQQATYFNLRGNDLFYQSTMAENDGIYHIDLATGQETLVFTGQYINISLTSQYLYCEDFISGAMVHMKYNNGLGAFSYFNPPILD